MDTLATINGRPAGLPFLSHENAAKHSFSHVAPNLVDAQKALVKRAAEEISRQEQLALKREPKHMTEIVL